jgi:catechol 2,3-dioxygenase
MSDLDTSEARTRDTVLDVDGWPKLGGPEYATMGEIHLAVTDLSRALEFWRDLAGLSIRRGDGNRIELGTEERNLIVLHAGANRPAGRGYSGLYHVAIRIPSEPEFARVLMRLIKARYRISPTEHTTSKSIYLNDSDGLMLEVALETPERVAKIVWDSPEGRYVIDRDGHRWSGIDPLDVQAVLKKLPDGEIDRPLPSGTKISHVNLYVGDLHAAYAFYRDEVGFTESTYVSSLGVADLFAGGLFPHRIAINTWQGVGAPQPPPGTAGLRHFTVVYDSAKRLESVAALIAEAQKRPDGYLVQDPAGNAVLLTTDGMEAELKDV